MLARVRVRVRVCVRCICGLGHAGARGIARGRCAAALKLIPRPWHALGARVRSDRPWLHKHLAAECEGALAQIKVCKKEDVKKKRARYESNCAILELAADLSQVAHLQKTAKAITAKVNKAIDSRLSKRRSSSTSSTGSTGACPSPARVLGLRITR